MIEVDKLTEANASLLLHHFHAGTPIGIISDHHAEFAPANWKPEPIVMMGDYVPSETERIVLDRLKSMARRAGISEAAQRQQDYRDAKNAIFAAMYGGPQVQQEALELWRKARNNWRHPLAAFEGYEKIQMPSGKIRTISYFDLGDQW